MAKQIIWSPLAKEALKDLLISSQERDGNKRCGGIFVAGLCTPCSKMHCTVSR